MVDEPAMDRAGHRASTRRLLVAVGVIAALAAAAVTFLLVTIVERKHEARNPFVRVVELDDTIVEPAVGGRNIPSQ